MLSRRNLRVKVMQTLYSMEHNAQQNPADAQKILKKNIDKAYRLLFFLLALPVRISNFIKKEQHVKSSKFLPTEQDRTFSAKFCGNPFIQILSENKQLQDLLKLEQSEEESGMVKSLFKDFSLKEEYVKYCTQTISEEQEEKKILLFLLSEVIEKSEDFLQYVEDNFPECVTELNRILMAAKEIVEQLSKNGTEDIFQFNDAKTEEDFAKELLKKTIEHEERFTELIEPKLKNWDMDRIARLDMVLMKMALCELIYFDQIPVKVSINEYIDISKIYSTPRSKDFVNGILDNIMHELRQGNAIRKTGRGLVE